MALWDEVKSRYNANELIRLTNPGDSTASAIDDTFGGLAATDAIAEFETITATTFDETNAKHVVACVAGTMVYLFDRSMLQPPPRELARWESSLRNVADIEGRNRVTPQTSVSVTVPVDAANARPDFGRNTTDVKQYLVGRERNNVK